MNLVKWDFLKIKIALIFKYHFGVYKMFSHVSIGSINSLVQLISGELKLMELSWDSLWKVMTCKIIITYFSFILGIEEEKLDYAARIKLSKSQTWGWFGVSIPDVRQVNNSSHLLGTYVPGTILITLNMWSHLKLTIILWGRHHHNALISKEGTEAQRGYSNSNY